MGTDFIIKEASSKFRIEELLKITAEINETKGSTVQIFYPDMVIDEIHLAGAYTNAVAAFKSHKNISKSIATEMLLFAAMTRQINDAIELVGAKSNKKFILFASNSSAYNKAKKVLDHVKEYKVTEKHSMDTAKKFGIDAKKDLDLFVLQKMAVSGLG
jgi:tRNA threonylcarbamoyladenosine modification (KEOPS) complex Cgi121 subunit